MTTTNPASPFGPIAEQEFVAAAEAHKPALAAWLDALPTLDDGEFTAQAAAAIHGSALVNSFRGNWEHEHCKATAAYAEAKRRHLVAGHSDDCTGDTIYSRAFRRCGGARGTARRRIRLGGATAARRSDR